MAFFDAFLKKSHGKSIALLEASPDSVAGAYVRYGGNAPALLYARRLPVERHAGEDQGAAALRTLDALGEVLVREGGPAALRASGSGSVSGVLVSIDPPWEEVEVRTEHIEKPSAFVFDENMAHLVLERTRREIAGKAIADESLVATLLNGYQTDAPYGKSAHRAALMVLTSYIEEKMVDAIEEKARSFFHARHVRQVASSSLRYEALRAAFPHEKNALVLSVSSSAISVQLIRDEILVAVTSVPRMPSSAHWTEGVFAQLAEFARHIPLPRTVFFIASQEDAEELRAAFAGAECKALWLSESPPAIVTVLPSHLVGLVEIVSGAAPDLPLLLMALYGSRKVAL